MDIIILLNMIVVSFFAYGLRDMINNFLKLKEKGARFYDPFIDIISCLKCLSFWITMIWTGSFIIACYVSFIWFITFKNFYRHVIFFKML